MCFTLQPISASTLQGTLGSMFLSLPMTVTAEDGTTASVGDAVGAADTGEIVGSFEGIEVVGLTLGVELWEMEGEALSVSVGSKVVG